MEADDMMKRFDKHVAEVRRQNEADSTSWRTHHCGECGYSMPSDIFEAEGVHHVAGSVCYWCRKCMCWIDDAPACPDFVPTEATHA